MFAKSSPQKEEILSLSPLIESCLQAEKVRNISDRSLKELSCHLGTFTIFCRERALRSLQELTPAFLKDFLLFRNPEGKASLGKILDSLNPKQIRFYVFVSDLESFICTRQISLDTPEIRCTPCSAATARP
jgi:hypothetical protein